MESSKSLFNSFFLHKKAITLGVFGFLFLLLPVFVFVLQQQQDIRQKASTPAPSPTPMSCPTIATDTLLLFDISHSMNGKAATGDPTTKFNAAKTGALAFVNAFSESASTFLGLVTFGSTENSMPQTIAKPLSSDFANLKTAINNLKIDSIAGTCMECAIVSASNELSIRGRSNVKKVFVFLTDGQAASTIKIPFNKRPGSNVSEKATIDAVKKAYTDHNVTIYTIGLGTNVNTSFLKEVASLTGGKYYFSPTSSNLTAIYNEIAIALSKGSVQGVVFEDANKNGANDTTDPLLQGWTVQAKNSSGTVVASGLSDNTGTFTLSGLCNGSYTVSQNIQSGWKQVQPANNEGYSITITNGAALDEKDFGNIKAKRCSDALDNDANGFADTNDSSCHTDANPKNTVSYDPNKDGENGGGSTCADSKDNNENNLIDGADPLCHTDGNAENAGSYDPNRPESGPANDSITLNLNVFLHGIGASGDNRNPASNMSNKNPLHPSRKSFVELFNNTNQLVASQEAVITYASASGSFLGTARFSIPGGIYTIKVKTEQHLRNQYPGIMTLALGDSKDLPPISLVTGDVNNDNKLDILDYNTLYGCYTSDLFPTPRNCTGKNTILSDLDDEGHVNLFDLNLFIRELSVQTGH